MIASHLLETLYLSLTDMFSLSGEDLMMTRGSINKTYRAIRKAVVKTLRQQFRLTKCCIEYPEVFFPERGIAATGYHLHILKIAAEMMLRFKLSEFALKPTVDIDEEGDRVYSDPSSALAFESSCKSVGKKFGPNVFPLCIAISGDDVQLNKKGSMGCKPWYVSLGNVRGALNTSEKNIECIGYSPQWEHTKVSANVLQTYVR